MEEHRIGTLTNHIGKSDVYKSSVVAEAILAGKVPEDIVIVGQLAYHDSSCSGGPRLRAGEKVLISLDRGFIDSDGAAEDESVWRIHHFLGKVLIDEDEATSQYASLGTEVGNAEALIRDYGHALGASSEQVEQAVAAAAGTSPASGGLGTQSLQDVESDADSSGLRTAGLVAGAVGVVVLAVAARFLRKHST